MPVAPGHLYLVSTPIGNLGDFSPRAVETLASVALILAEDTRHSRRLLDHYSIRTPTASYHEHNEARTAPRIVERLLAGESVALVSDAGTPLLSDPGERLVNAAIEAGIRVVPIPGASALLAALVASGMDATRFTFFGFPPRKGRERANFLADVVRLPHTAVLYEAPGRVAATLEELEAAGAGERRVAVARELTKQFEELRRGTVAELARYYQDSPPRGEVVMVVAGGEVRESVLDEDALRNRASKLLAEGMSARDVARILAAEHGLSRNDAYRLAQEAGSVAAPSEAASESE
ncbi:MAG TPA: 16S rRNA (cytidine(1402)-2'-O)-methyltransferase [Gemmatimonadaceae bacterium]|nr:16S rRNA (cytidine(1402)-2'-O)-methyltransferase [Gemmatimonadaceae bacterium]